MSPEEIGAAQRAAEQPMMMRMTLGFSTFLVASMAALRHVLDSRSGLELQGWKGHAWSFGVPLALGAYLVWRVRREYRSLPTSAREACAAACVRLSAKLEAGETLSLRISNALGISSSYEVAVSEGWILLKGRGLGTWLSQIYAPGRFHLKGEGPESLWATGESSSGTWSARARMDAGAYGRWLAAMGEVL